MKLLITGICGFVGTALSREFLAGFDNLEILGIDNLSRRGSERNWSDLADLGVKLIRADLRNASDLEMLPAVDWVVDAAAIPSVTSGVDGKISSRQVMEHNLWGTVNLLEYCRAHRPGLVLLSTSRVYSISPLAGIPMEVRGSAFCLARNGPMPTGLGNDGVAEDFSTAPPISLYGSSKLASESLALEYGDTFGFPVWVNRCGVLSGAGQFGKPDQGIFSFWLNAHLRRRPLKYVGFGGKGYQVRDCLHPRDLAMAIRRQMVTGFSKRSRIVNLGGGCDNSISLASLTDWCNARFGRHPVSQEPKTRPFDIPWLVLDCSRAHEEFGWEPTMPLEEILTEIAQHAEQHPEWLDVSTSE